MSNHVKQLPSCSQYVAASGLFAVIVGSFFSIGCRSGFDSIQAVFDRHASAVEKLPEEEQARLMPYGPPVASERAESLLPTDMLSLETARAIAIRANPDIHAAYARLEGARARIAETRARYFPTLSFSHVSTRTFQTPASRNRLNTLLQPAQPVPAGIDSGSFAVTTLINALRLPLFGADEVGGNTNSYSENATAFTLTWTVFDGFVREARLLATKHLYRASEESLADVERLIIRAVDSAYYRTQLAREQLRISLADEIFSQEQLEETEKLRAAGRATLADVDNFRVRVLAAQTDATAATGLMETGRVVLAELMGLSDVIVPPDIGLSPLTEESEREMTVPDPQPLIEEALENRPDMIEFEELVKTAQEELRAAQGLFLPVVAVSGSWGFDHVSNLRYTDDDQSSAAVLEFRWELFTGGARRARVRIAQSSLAEIEAGLESLRLAVQSEVRQAIIDLNDAQQRIRLQRQTLETALENRRIVRAGYLAGKETLTRLNEAQRDYIEADANLALARVRLRQAWSDLNAAVATHRRADEPQPPPNESPHSEQSPQPGPE